MCLITQVFLLFTLANGSIDLKPVSRESLKPEIQKELDRHKECQRRKLGKCHIKLILKPDTGHKYYICGSGDRGVRA